MLGWVGDIEEVTLANEVFRSVLFTGAQLQLTVMRLGPGEEIGREVHPDRDQFIRVESGTARVELATGPQGVDEHHDVRADWAVVIPAGVWHNVVNTGPGPVQLYSLYAPPEHPPGAVHATKAEADAAEQEHHG